jgi:hypothetical protein
VNGGGGGSAVHLRHLQVHQDHIRAMRPEAFDRLRAIARFRCDDHVGFALDHGGDALAEKWVVIDDQHTDSSV